MYFTKIDKKFLKIETKIISMNDAKYKLKSKEVIEYELFCKSHIELKFRYKAIQDSTNALLSQTHEEAWAIRY